VIVAVFLLAGSAAAGWWFFLKPAPARADVLLHKVKLEPLSVTVTEKGTLESAANIDIVCKVRAGTKGYASTIKWVIEDGARIKPGQPLMVLDDSALKDQEDDQSIKAQGAEATEVKARLDLKIAEKQAEKDLAMAESTLITAENALKNYTGLTFDPARAPLAALGGGPVALVEAGTFRQSVDDLSGKVRLADADAEQYRERAAWADRMVKLSYLSAAQAQAERSKLESAVENLRSLRAKLDQLLNSDREQTLTKLILDRNIAQISFEQTDLAGKANVEKAKAELRRAIDESNQQDERLTDIKRQRAECKIVAPANTPKDSIVVYFKSESGRFGSSSSQALIEQGAQVKEGQKMLRIPNLRNMQVNTKVHEAMVARVKGEVRVPTYFVDAVQARFKLNPYTDLLTHSHEVGDWLRDALRAEEYRTTVEGQKAVIRVDALAGRVFHGHVRTVATIASQDAWAPDVKLYQTIVRVDHEVLADGTKREIASEELKPDMTAEVTITVDTADKPVLTVPVQAVMGSSDLGGAREVYVKTDAGEYKRVAVKLGLYNEKVVEIRDGLKEGDEVVLNPKVLLDPADKTKTRDDPKGGTGGGSKGGDPKGDAPKGDAPKGDGTKKGKRPSP
jgi:multidrug efflux pump subunit AcrA (membrane-fusion protein)